MNRRAEGHQPHARTVRLAAVAAVAAVAAGGFVAPSSADEVSAATSDPVSYANAVELLNLASESDQAMRSAGGWRGTIALRAFPDARPNQSLDRALALADGRREVVFAFASDLRTGRTRMSVGRAWYKVIGETAYQRLARPAKTRAALRKVGKPNATAWRSPMDSDSAKLVRLAAAYLGPSAQAQSVVGAPADVGVVTRRETPAGLVFSGKGNVWGEPAQFSVTFTGTKLTAMGVRIRGVGRADATYQYGRPEITRPEPASVVNAVALAKAYAVVAGQQQIHSVAKMVAKGARIRLRKSHDPDKVVASMQRFSGPLWMPLGPSGVFVTDRGAMIKAKPIAGGVLLYVHNRFGFRGEKVTLNQRRSDVVIRKASPKDLR